MSGSMTYSKTTDYQEPIHSKTKNKWFIENTKKLGIGRKQVQRQVAVFTKSACIGYEEILREYINCRNDNEFYNKRKVTGRDFTCVCESIEAKVMFLNHDDFMWVIKTCVDLPLIEQIFKERRSIIRSTIGRITAVNDKISGFSNLEPPEKSIEPEIGKTKKAVQTEILHETNMNRSLFSTNETPLLNITQYGNSIDLSSNLSPPMGSSRAAQVYSSRNHVAHESPEPSFSKIDVGQLKPMS